MPVCYIESIAMHNNGSLCPTCLTGIWRPTKWLVIYNQPVLIMSDDTNAETFLYHTRVKYIALKHVLVSHLCILFFIVYKTYILNWLLISGRISRFAKCPAILSIVHEPQCTFRINEVMHSFMTNCICMFDDAENFSHLPQKNNSVHFADHVSVDEFNDLILVGCMRLFRHRNTIASS